MIEDLRQSKEWGKFLKHLGWEVDEYQVSDIWCQVLVRKIPLLGSIIKIQRPPDSIDLEIIDKIARKHRALFVKLEPRSLPESSGSAERSRSSKAYGFVKDSWPLLPTKTIWIDLTKSEQQLLGEMKKDTRYCIRRAEREGLSTTSYPLSEKSAPLPLKDFYNLLKETGKRGKFWVPPYNHLKAKAKSFGLKGFLVAAFPPNKKTMLTGAMVFIHGEAAFYHHAASSKKGQGVFAPYAVMWETIKLAKRQGCEILDLEGIYDTRYSKLTRRWGGFTHFKKGFGGEIISFPGSYTKHYNLFTRLLFKFQLK